MLGGNTNGEGKKVIEKGAAHALASGMGNEQRNGQEESHVNMNGFLIKLNFNCTA